MTPKQTLPTLIALSALLSLSPVAAEHPEEPDPGPPHPLLESPTGHERLDEVVRTLSQPDPSDSASLVQYVDDSVLVLSMLLVDLLEPAVDAAQPAAEAAQPVLDPAQPSVALAEKTLNTVEHDARRQVHGKLSPFFGLVEGGGDSHCKTELLHQGQATLGYEEEERHVVVFIAHGDLGPAGELLHEHGGGGYDSDNASAGTGAHAGTCAPLLMVGGHAVGADLGV